MFDSCASLQTSMCPVSRAQPQHLGQVVPADGALPVPAFARLALQRRPAGLWSQLLRIPPGLLYVQPDFINRRNF